jgi:hypothetical protein
MSSKNKADDLTEYSGRIETQPVPFFRFIRITILISVILALIMIMLK